MSTKGSQNPICVEGENDQLPGHVHGHQQGYGQHNTNVPVAGQPVSSVIAITRPNAHLGFAIFTCLCCFWPTGIVAIICACMSQSSNDREDYGKAVKEGKLAKIFSIVSLVIGLIWMIAVIIYLIMIFVVFAAAVSSASNG